MKVIYVAGEGLVGATIRAFERGQWSHVGVIDGDHVIEAVWNDGVRYRQLDSLLLARPEHEILTIDLPNEAGAIDWLRSQIGKPYDWTGVLGLGFNRNWQEESRWYCSELTASAAIKGGRPAPVNLRRLGVKASYIWFGGENP